MITPSQFRTAVRNAVEAALPTARRASVPVNWSGGAREFGDLRLLLDVISEVEECDREELFATDGQRLSASLRVVVQVRAESTYDTADSDALDLLNSVRFGVRRTSVSLALTAAGVEPVGAPSTTRNVSFRSNQRLVSSHAFELEFRTVFGLQTEEQAGQIEHVELAGSVASPSSSDVVSFDLTVDDPTPEP